MDVAAALAACRTPADHYRVQLDAENVLEPAAAMALHARVETLPPAAHEWVHRLAEMTRRVHPVVEPYRRHDLAGSASFYEGQGPAGAPRSLVVGFTGVGQRMMVPIAPFLQGLPAARCDVLILRDSSRAAYLAGVPGYAPDLPALAARLARDIPLARYSDRRCVGTSSGVAAALAFGPIFGATVALGLGGMSPVAMRLQQASDDLDRRQFSRLLLAASPGPTRLVSAHGQACQRDAVRSALLAMTIPACRLLSVAGVRQHGVVLGLYLIDAWRRFADEVLLGDGLPADGIWRPPLVPLSQPVADCPG
jgi:hypothetical protein